VKCDHDLVKISDVVEGKLINEDGFEFQIKGYVYAISYINNICVIKILCVDPSFLRTPHTNSFSSITDAINSLYPGDIEVNTQSDLLNDIPIYQIGESNYSLCTKLAKSFKKSTIFGYGLGSMRFNDLKNFESKYDFGAKVDLKEVTPPELNDPKLYNFDINFIDYSSGKDPNHVLVEFNNKVYPVNKKYQDLIGNYLFNSKLKVTKNIGNYELRYLPPVQICDGVTVQNRDLSIEKLFVSHREIMINYNELRVNLTLQSIEP
jgi:hypothetical protein